MKGTSPLYEKPGNCRNWRFVDFIDLELRSQDFHPISLTQIINAIGVKNK